MQSGNNILVIDDSNTNVVLLEAILSTQGHSIQTALSIKEALPIIKKQKPALILLDLLMPEISGYDFLAQMREDTYMKDIPVVVVSAVTDDENIKMTKDLGAVEFITKPIDIPHLIELVSKYVK